MEQTHSQNVFNRILKNKLAVFSLSGIGIAVFLAVFAYLIIPDKSPYANNQQLEINIFMGATPNQTSIPIQSYKIVQDSLVASPFTKLKTYVPHAIKYPLTTFFSVSFLKTASKSKLEAEVKTLFVQKHFWLGTDNFGRDLLSRLIVGMRVSLSVGFIAVLIALLVGTLLGSIAGYYGGRTDSFILWLINVIWSLPSLLLIIAITFALGKGFWQVFIAIGLSMWVEIARVVRGQVIAYKNLEYIEAARALGYSNFRIIWHHILPNILAPVIVLSAANFASAILVEAGLSFLGLGIPPPIPSWGSMIRENYSAIFFDSAYLALLPGLAILLIVLAFMLFGKGLREALNVRSY